MKKSLSLILAVAAFFVFALTGCTNGNDDTTTTSRGDTTSTATTTNERATEGLSERVSDDMSEMMSDAQSLLPDAEDGAVTDNG